MLNLRYQKATLEDLELLVTVRCRVITRKPILPTDQEMEENPRSKSAKLRVFEKS